MIPPTPRPPPAFACAEPGPWQFSQSNLPFCVLPMRAISVFSNAAAWLEWQVKQPCAPTTWASTGAVECLPPATGPFDAAGGCAEEPPCRKKSSKLSASANFGWLLIDSGWAVPMPCAKLRSAAKVWSSYWRSVLCDVLSRADLGCSTPICCAKELSAENAESPAICWRGWLDSCVLAACDQPGSVELMPATVKVLSALAD